MVYNVAGKDNFKRYFFKCAIRGTWSLGIGICIYTCFKVLELNLGYFYCRFLSIYGKNKLKSEIIR